MSLLLQGLITRDGWSVLDNDAAVDLAVLHLVEDGIDLAQVPGGHGRVNLAAGIELEGLHQVLAGADDGAAHGEPLEDDLEDRCGEVPGRKAVEDDGAAAP